MTLNVWSELTTEQLYEEAIGFVQGRSLVTDKDRSAMIEELAGRMFKLYVKANKTKVAAAKAWLMAQQQEGLAEEVLRVIDAP